MQKNYCPNCGTPLNSGRSPTMQPTNQYQVRRAQMGGAPVDAYSMAEFVQPARAADIAADMVTPAAQAIFTGLLVGFVAMFPALYYKWPFYIVAAVAGVTWLIAWLILLGEHRRSLWNVERYQQEPPAAQTAVAAPREIGVKLAIQEDGKHIKYAHLPIEHDKLRKVARAVNNGRSFSVASLTGRGKPLTRAELETLRDWLFSAGYAVWSNPNNHALGVDFTAKGRALWRALGGAK